MHMETQIKSRETIENNDASFFRSIQAYGIDYCYSQMVDNQSNLLVIPDGCIDLLFACKQEKPEITFYGPMSKHKYKTYVRAIILAFTFYQVKCRKSSIKMRFPSKSS